MEFSDRVLPFDKVPLVAFDSRPASVVLLGGALTGVWRRRGTHRQQTSIVTNVRLITDAELDDEQGPRSLQVR